MGSLSGQIEAMGAAVTNADYKDWLASQGWQASADSLSKYRQLRSETPTGKLLGWDAYQAKKTADTQATQAIKDNALLDLTSQGRKATILTDPMATPNQGATLLTQSLAPSLDPTKNQNGNPLDTGNLLRRKSVI